MENISVSDQNTFFSDKDGVLFNKEMSLLILYPAQKSNSKYTIPEGVTEITERAFDNCCAIESVILPKNSVSIKNMAFTGCQKLKDITIHNNETSLGAFVFANCPEFTTVYFNGTAEEFSKINTGTANYNFEDASKVYFHYVNFGNHSIKLNDIKNGSKIIFALYNNDRLTDIQSVDFNSENIVFVSDKAYDSAKIFVWEDFTTLVPIIDAIDLV